MSFSNAMKRILFYSIHLLVVLCINPFSDLKRFNKVYEKSQEERCGGRE